VSRGKETKRAREGESSRCCSSLASGVDGGRSLSTRSRPNVGRGERRDGEEGGDGKGEH